MLCRIWWTPSKTSWNILTCAFGSHFVLPSSQREWNNKRAAKLLNSVNVSKTHNKFTLDYDIQMFVFSYSALVYFKQSHLKPWEISFFLSEFVFWVGGSHLNKIYTWNLACGMNMLERAASNECFRLQMVMKTFFFFLLKPVLFSNLATH